MSDHSRKITGVNYKKKKKIHLVVRAGALSRCQQGQSIRKEPFSVMICDDKSECLQCKKPFHFFGFNFFHLNLSGRVWHKVLFLRWGFLYSGVLLLPVLRTSLPVMSLHTSCSLHTASYILNVPYCTLPTATVYTEAQSLSQNAFHTEPTVTHSGACRTVDLSLYEGLVLVVMCFPDWSPGPSLPALPHVWVLRVIKKYFWNWPAN